MPRTIFDVSSGEKGSLMVILGVPLLRALTFFLRALVLLSLADSSRQLSYIHTSTDINHYQSVGPAQHVRLLRTRDVPFLGSALGALGSSRCGCRQAFVQRVAVPSDLIILTGSTGNLDGDGGSLAGIGIRLLRSLPGAPKQASLDVFDVRVFNPFFEGHVYISNN